MRLLTAADRKAIEEAFAASLFLQYRGYARQARERLAKERTAAGFADRPVPINIGGGYRSNPRRHLEAVDPTADFPMPQRVQQLIVEEVRAEAKKVQDGVNVRIQAARDSVEGIADAQVRARARDAAVKQAVEDIHAYNAKTLFPYYESYARHQALLEVYRNTPDPNQANPTRSAADGLLWNWEQRTDFNDDCTDAQDSSPAPLDVLFGIAGGPPPIHRNCDCILDPSDQSVDGYARFDEAATTRVLGSVYSPADL